MNLKHCIETLTSIKELLNEKKSSAKAKKSRVKTYDTIKQALSDGHYGQMFTTKGANRIYVLSKGKWGSKSGRGKIAKGFTPGSATPNASFKSIKKFAARTMIRHGKSTSSTLKNKYAPGAKEK
tara:strand:+ start:584 stop:955 length:372 start_codon:yes stop_codon:yes gene_type:complete